MTVKANLFLDRPGRHDDRRNVWSVECMWVNMSRRGCSWNSHCALPDWSLRVLFVSIDESHRTREGCWATTLKIQEKEVY